MSSVITGARVVFTINNVTIAAASNCSYVWRHNLETIEAIDELEVVEHAELGSTIEFTCDTFRIAGKGVIALGLMPRLRELLEQPELVATFKDKITNTILLQVTGIKMTSRTGTIPARGPFTESLSFVARSVKDESF